jgi:hypothetical protein
MGHALELQFEGLKRKFKVLVRFIVFKEKQKKKSSKLGCSVMRVETMLKDVGAGENSAKAQVVLKYSPTHLKTRLQRRCL